MPTLAIPRMRSCRMRGLTVTQMLIVLSALGVAMSIVPATASTPSQSDVKSLLTQIKSGHRVLWLDGGETQLKSNVAADSGLACIWKMVQRTADETLAEPVVKRELIGRRLLDKSRTALQRTMSLGMAYRMTGDRRYADRAIQEMLGVASFADWNPSHFLDVAEMTAAMAIGLDWCRDAMSQQDIAAVRQAIIDKGLNTSLAEPYSWIHGDNNWNQVCHCGLTLGALAVSDTDPELAAKIIVRAIEGLPFVMKQYAPDGAYPEGVSYWGYGTTYNVMGLHALQSALGTDFGLSQQPGFRQTGNYMLHAVGPTGLDFNYSDCGRPTQYPPVPIPAAAQFYFAQATHVDSVAYPDRQWITLLRKASDAKLPDTDSTRFLPLALLWANPSATEAPRSLHYVGNGVTPIAAFRTGWDHDATYAAIKAGAALTNHAHMDSGTFVIDALGERWVDSLGMQSYESLEHAKVDLWNMKQSSPRWQVFRIGPMSQNVLTVDDQLQQVSGRSTIVKSKDDRAVIDLSPVYEHQLNSARRGIWLEPSGCVMLRDEITAAGCSGTVRFAFLTRAKIDLKPDGAVLNLNGKILRFTVTGLPGLRMETYSTVGPQPFDATNPGTEMVGFRVRLSPGDEAAWNVEFVPEGKSTSASAGLLSEW